MRKLAAGVSLPADARWAFYRAYYGDAELLDLYSPQLRAELADEHAWSEHIDYVREAPAADFLDKMLYADWKTFLPELNLAYCDKLSMAASVETRVPYLDNEIVDFMCRVPPELKLRGTTSKYLLREAVKDLVPGADHPASQGRLRRADPHVAAWRSSGDGGRSAQPRAYRGARLLRCGGGSPHDRRRQARTDRQHLSHLGASHSRGVAPDVLDGQAVKQVTQSMRDGRIEILDVPVPASRRPQGALIRTAWSLISAGTEGAKIDLGQKSLVAKARSRPDQVKQVLDKVRQDGVLRTYRTVKARLEERNADRLQLRRGRHAVGELAPASAVGDRVACGGADYAKHAEVDYVPATLWRAFPTASDGGGGVRHRRRGRVAGRAPGGATVGDRVAVIGLGLLGQITVQCCARRAVRSRRRPGRRRCAACWHSAPTASVPRPARSRKRGRPLHRGRGSDAVIITAGTRSDEPVEHAGEIARDRGSWSWSATWAWTCRARPTTRRSSRCKLSRSYGPGRYDPSYEERPIDYPLGYVRWTEQRNMEEFLRLVAAGKVRLSPLISHRFPVEEAAGIRLRRGRPEEPSGCCSSIRASTEVAGSAAARRSRPRAPADELAVGASSARAISPRRCCCPTWSATARGRQRRAHRARLSARDGRDEVRLRVRDRGGAHRRRRHERRGHRHAARHPRRSVIAALGPESTSSSRSRSASRETSCWRGRRGGGRRPA